MALTEPLVGIMGGTAASCELYCRVCDHAFLSNPGDWCSDRGDVSALPLSQLVRALTEHVCTTDEGTRD